VSTPRRPELVIPPSATTSLPKLPTYVEHGGEISCRHPADAINSRMYGFVIDASRDRLDAYCERLFNRPTGGREHWVALGSEVLLNFVDIPTMGSTDWLDQELGVVHEREAAIWFPVFERRRNSFAWAIPYMFVDSALALAGGREVYGFPKQMGNVKIPPRDKAAPSELSVSTVTLRKYAPDSEAKSYRVVRVARAGEPAVLTSLSADPGKAVGEMRKMVVPELLKGDLFGRLARLLRTTSQDAPDLHAGAMFLAHLLGEDAPMLLLKQFRDAHEPGAACYQALVLVDMVVSKLRGGGFLPDGYGVEVARLDGEPISRELGVPESCKPRLAFWLDFDFVVQLGNILWEAPVG
jgi:Acetoacetate decarboxylase (ADC)